jgi:hypothetical protein
VAYFWSAQTRLDGGWREEVERFVAAVPGVVLGVAEGEEMTVRLSEGGCQPVEMRFVRRRGAGAVVMTSGTRLVLVSLGVAVRMQLELSDGNGDALDRDDMRALLRRIPFGESAITIEALAEEVGVLPRRVRLTVLSSSAACRRHGGVFFG